MTAAAPVMAQGTSDDSSGDIIVTARRTEERLQDVPISITVFSQEAISDRNVVTATDLATYTPSLSVNQRFGPEKAAYSIRGFVQENSTAPSVGVYFADVSFGRAQGGTTSGGTAPVGSFMDLQNVQVLKGPQGTLFGRNTTGGAVLLVPQKPTDRLEGFVEASIGDYNMKRGQAVLNIPLTDTFKVRFAVDRNKREGYMKNHSGIGPKDYNDINYFAARMSIVADLTPDIENYTVATYSHSFSHGYGSRIVVCNRANAASNPTRFPTNGVTALQALAGCDQIARQNARGDGPLDVEINNPKGLIDLTHWQVINTTTWKASDTLTVKNIASFQEFRERSFYALNSDNFVIPAYETVGGVTGFNLARINPALAFVAPAGTPFMQTLLNPRGSEYNSAQSTFSEELQLQGGTSDGSFNYVVGGYMEISRPIGWSAGRTVTSALCADGANLVCTNPIFFGGVSQSAIRSKFTTHALFAQGTYKFTEQLSMTAGLRYTWDDTLVRAENTRLTLGVAGRPNTLRCNDFIRFPSGTPGQGRVVTSPEECPQAFPAKSSKPTWLIDVDYKPTPDILVYAKWARGYRQGGANPTNVALETSGPEQVDLYEAGLKATFRGATPGYINIAAFYNDFKNQQLVANGVASAAAQAAGFQGAQAIVNAGQSRIQGIEVDGSVNFFDSLRLDVGYAYIDSKLQSIERVPFPTELYADLVYSSVVGGPLAQTPKHRLTVTGTYTLPLDESIGKISLGATYIYTSNQYFSRADDRFIPCVAGGTAPGICPNGFGFANIPLYGNNLTLLPSSSLVNINVSWNNVMGSPVDAAFFMTNVTNEIYPVAVGSALSSNGYETLNYAPPRMFGFRLRYSFGS